MRGQPLDWLLPNRIANGCPCRTNLWRGLSCVITTPTLRLPSTTSSNQQRNLWWQITQKSPTSFKECSAFFPGSCEAPIRSCSYLFDVAAISERLLCPEKMEQTTSMITFMLWIENKKAKGTDNMFTSNGHTGCTCYCYGSFSLLWRAERSVTFPMRKLAGGWVTS